MYLQLEYKVGLGSSCSVSTQAREIEALTVAPTANGGNGGARYMLERSGAANSTLQLL
jgi:hypothetical protein